MLTLRRDQLAALAEGARREQKARLLAHLREASPAQCADLGSVVLSGFVDQALAAANQAGRYLDKSVFPFVEALFNEKWTEPAIPAMKVSSPLKL